MDVPADQVEQLTQEVEQLRRQLGQLEDALENMHHGLCMFDGDKRLAVCNGRYAELLALPEDVVRPGMSAADLIAHGIAAGYYDPDKTADEIESDMWANLAASADARHTLNRGGRIYAIYPRRTERGNLVTTFEDVTSSSQSETALRESEARLSAILQAIPDCVKIFDESGRLTEINPAGLELLQAPDLQSLQARGEGCVAPEYSDTSAQVHRRVMAGETVTGTYEVVGLRGRRRHVDAHSVPINLPDGSKAQLCISRDVSERKDAEDALRLSERRLRLVHEATGLAEFEAHSDGRAFCSERMAAQLGFGNEACVLEFEEWLAAVHADDRDRVRAEILHSVDSSHSFQSEFRIVRRDTGETRWISSHAYIQRGADGGAMRSIGAHLDITERKRAEEALRESEERFRLAAEGTGIGVWDYDPELGRREWSARLLEIFGLPQDVQPSLELAAHCIHADDRATFLAVLHEIRDGNVADRFQGSYRIIRADDRAERWIMLNCWKITRHDRRSRIILTIRDITDEKLAEERIRWSAGHDPLTRLANRARFQERLDKAIRSAARGGGEVGLLLLDLDHFKQINDALGHDAGDKLLQMFARRLESAVRAGDTVARLGGDEFAVILPRLKSPDVLAGICASIHARLKEPFVHSGRMLDCRTSIGAAIYPRHGGNSEDLLKNADMALYSAKDGGRSNTAVFEPRLREEGQKRASMVELARAAIRDDRIITYYQPKLDLRRGAITGFEALLRWRDADAVIQYPASLEAAFEDHDVAADLSERVIRQAIGDMRGWLDAGVAFDHVAVNASAAEFRRDNFAERVLESLSRADIPTRHFQLEVTEKVFLGRGAEYVQRALTRLSEAGVRIALDDFGTGYASLRHLKQFPVDIIKIDRSFVQEMENDRGDEAIIRAVINLGRTLGIRIVAEGIERMSQAEKLIAFGCDYGQGFLFSHAVPGDSVPSLVARMPQRTPDEREAQAASGA